MNPTILWVTVNIITIAVALRQIRRAYLRGYADGEGVKQA